MRFFDGLNGPSAPLPLIGGVVQAQRLVIPPEAVRGLKTWRHACRLAWRLRNPRNLTQRQLVAAVPGLYASHVSDYFSANPARRELPARWVGPVQAVLGNLVMSQWLAMDQDTTLIEELQYIRRAA